MSKKIKGKIIVVGILALIFLSTVIVFPFFITSSITGFCFQNSIEDNLSEEQNNQLQKYLIEQVEKSNNYNTFYENGQRIGKLSDYYGLDNRFKLPYHYVQAYLRYTKLACNYNDDYKVDMESAKKRIDLVIDIVKPKFIYKADKIKTIRSYDKEIVTIDPKTKTSIKKIVKVTEVKEENINLLVSVSTLEKSCTITYKTQSNKSEEVSGGKDTIEIIKPVMDVFKSEEDFTVLKSTILQQYPKEDVDKATEVIITMAKNYIGENYSDNMMYTGGGTYTGKGEPFTGSQLEFAERIAKPAIAFYPRSGVLPSITIAQAIIESGWGKSGLTQKANNLFGIKAIGSWKGPYIEMLTHEYKGQVITAPFRAYPSWAASIEDHNKFLIENSRYAAHGFFRAKNYEEAAMALQSAGYATTQDPVTGEEIYARELINMIRSHQLDKYDMQAKGLKN